MPFVQGAAVSTAPYRALKTSTGSRVLLKASAYRDLRVSIGYTTNSTGL